jgi:hypothetical protein
METLNMKSLLASAALLLLSSSVFAQSAPSDKITLTITRAELQVIGNGLAELPYKTAAQVMNDLQAQLTAADQAAAKAAADAAKPAEKPAEAPAAKTEDAPTK